MYQIAHEEYHATDSDAYDEALLEVSERVEERGSVGKPSGICSSQVCRPRGCRRGVFMPAAKPLEFRRCPGPGRLR